MDLQTLRLVQTHCYHKGLHAQLEVCAAVLQWRMKDRFAGFRFEVHGSVSDVTAFTQAAQDKADELASFGWIQVCGECVVHLVCASHGKCA